MAFDLDRARREYAEDGLTVLRGAIPPDLLARLRGTAEELRAITRKALGPGATRPPGGYVGGRVAVDFEELVDTAAFKEFEEAPVVRAFVDEVLGPEFTNDHGAFTILYEAEDREIVQGWHRDYRDNVPWLDADHWTALLDDLRYFNQFNAALYYDVSLCVVPGSHRRDDTPGENAVVRGEGAVALPALDEPSSPEVSAAYAQEGDAYVRSMPGAVRVVLAPGDVAMYRDSALHLGHYVPTVKRATLHGHFESDVTRQFFENTFAGRLMDSPLYS